MVFENWEMENSSWVSYLVTSWQIFDFQTVFLDTKYSSVIVLQMTSITVSQSLQRYTTKLQYNLPVVQLIWKMIPIKILYLKLSNTESTVSNTVQTTNG